MVAPGRFPWGWKEGRRGKGEVGGTAGLSMGMLERVVPGGFCYWEGEEVGNRIDWSAWIGGGGLGRLADGGG